MSSFRFAVAGAMATFAIVFGGQQASAQQASGQFYGYASGQAPMPSGQDQYGGPGACHPDRVGCQVEVCPRPCQNVHIPVPGFEYPSCQNPYVIQSELPPPPPIWVTVWRNHYVPIKIENVYPPKPVQPVNIQVRWREVHYLCDCAPGTSQCPHIPSGSSQQGSPQADASVLPDPDSPLRNVSAPAAPSAPATPAVVVREKTPAKRWVWLEKQGLYGFGYQRKDGLWVVDPSSKRPTLPEGQSLEPAVNMASTASTGS